MKKVIWLNYNCDDYDYDEDWVNDSNITYEDLEFLGRACFRWFYAEMSDSYSVTLREQESIKKDVKPLTDKYNLEYHYTSFWAL